jgi:pantoate--beta-alanine ligase
MMETLSKVADLRNRIGEWRRAGERIALVPTMGNLHAGHLDLVRRAREQAARVVVSIFVNPMQFGPTEDFAAYPRTLDADREKLRQAGADLVFAPRVQEVYPDGQVQQTRVEVPEISNQLCGASRPGHFVGVATVVCKLFNMVQPDLAIFGEKDFQQLLVIRRMTRDLSLPVDIVGAPTVREADGLAMSSRNGYLNAEERALAPRLYANLQQAARALGQGDGVAHVEADTARALEQAGFRPDYVSVRRAADLGLPGESDRELVILAAAQLGPARLIDNLRVSLS